MPARGTRVPDSYAPNVTRYGRVSKETYLGLLTGASALVLSLSRTNYPVGITVSMDAMALSAGVPIVATDPVGHRLPG